MQESLQRILTGSMFFTVTLIIAILGYMAFGWSMLDAVYMVVITIFGVGYGEVEPLESPAEKLFTIGVIIAGTSSAVYIVGGFFQMVTEGEIHRALDGRRKDRELDDLDQHVIICGFGRIGQVLTQQLATAKQPFVVIDNNADRIATAESLGYLAYQGNATAEEVLQAVGIDQAKILATVLPDDALNVFITLTARGLNPDLTIVARGELPSTEKKLQQAGADQVVLPATLSALQMSHLITRPTAFNFLEQQNHHSQIREILGQMDLQMDDFHLKVDSYLVGQTVGDVASRSRGEFLIVALQHEDESITVHPDEMTVLHQGETLITLGYRGNLPQFAKAQTIKRQLRYRGRGVK